MDGYADMAAAILEEVGEPVLYTPGMEAPFGLSAVVSRYGHGSAPMGWPPDLFRNQARHAQFRLSAADVTAPSTEDSITVDGMEYEVRAIRRDPVSGPDVMWWVFLCACEQRGGRP